MTVLASSAVDAPLSSAMREGSRAEHEAAEGSSFMSELLAGRVNHAGYAAYLARLRTVYAAIETTGRHLAGTPAADAVLDPALDRGAAIDADLAYWGPHLRPGDEASAAATAYATRVRDSADWAPAFVAHHYTRYLGDLSGGQAIGRILGRAFDLADSTGVAFYAFEEIGKPKPYKDRYRARLDALDLDTEAKQRVVDEVKVAFTLNQALFTELSTDLDAYRR